MLILWGFRGRNNSQSTGMSSYILPFFHPKFSAFIELTCHLSFQETVKKFVRYTLKELEIIKSTFKPMSHFFTDDNLIITLCLVYIQLHWSIASLLLLLLLVLLHVNVRYKQFFIVLTYWYVEISCLDHLLHGDFAMVFVLCFDSNVVEINFGFYFSIAKGRTVLFGFLFSRSMVVWIVALFLPRNVLLDPSSNMHFICFLADVSLSSLRMCPSKFHLLLVTSIDTGFELAFSYNLLLLILWSHLIFSICLSYFLWKLFSCCSSWIFISRWCSCRAVHFLQACFTV